MRVISIILIIAVSIFTLLGSSANTMPQIGFSVYDMKFDFFKEMEKATRSHLKELGNYNDTVSTKSIIEMPFCIKALL